MWAQQGSKHVEVAHIPPLPPPLARQGAGDDDCAGDVDDYVDHHDEVEHPPPLALTRWLTYIFCDTVYST